MQHVTKLLPLLNFPNLCMFICYFSCSYKLHKEDHVHEYIEQDKCYCGFAEETRPVQF